MLRIYLDNAVADSSHPNTFIMACAMMAVGINRVDTPERWAEFVTRTTIHQALLGGWAWNEDGTSYPLGPVDWRPFMGAYCNTQTMTRAAFLRTISAIMTEQSDYLAGTVESEPSE
jgi:hypothetical protein